MTVAYSPSADFNRAISSVPSVFSVASVLHLAKGRPTI